MVNSGEVNGVPVHASKELLDDLLRKKMGFEGVIVTDIKDIDKIVNMHKSTPSHKEAVLWSVNAGIDMYMACNSLDFIADVKELMKEGKISEQRIDLSVKRILKLKEDLGLFENPYPDSSGLKNIGTEEHYIKAVELAEESLVLLKNDGILPLKGNQKILITGMGANSKLMMNGAWTLDWMGAPEEQQPANTKTLKTALENEFGKENVNIFESERVNSSNTKEYEESLEASDVVIAAIGEKPYSEFMGNINDLNLDSGQRNLVNYAIKAGKKVIIILLEGRPRLITKEAESSNAVIFAGHPGTGGAEAIANILAGKTNPSGKLSFTYPYSPGHTHPYYIKPGEYNIYWRPDTVRRNLYEFGHGLSYSKIEYKNLELSDTIMKIGKTITASVEITNKSDIAAKEAVLWFISDKYGRITRPIKQLKEFNKIDLPAGIKYKAEFVITEEHLKYPDKNGNTILEPGEFSIMVKGLEMKFELK
jgi:beta-glucosidase